MKLESISLITNDFCSVPASSCVNASKTKSMSSFRDDLRLFPLRHNIVTR